MLDLCRTFGMSRVCLVSAETGPSLDRPRVFQRTAVYARKRCDRAGHGRDAIGNWKYPDPIHAEGANAP
jgi:hypothetical protein